MSIQAVATNSPAGVDAAVSTAVGEGRISAPLVAALEAAWSAIRARHPELPAAVLVVGAGSGRGTGSGGLKLGHYAALRWHHEGLDGAAGKLPEVFIGGEGLARGPVGVLGTLLHEAAHALAHERGIKDTSRQGRWHNTRFKELATEVGISVEKDARIGWSPTTVPAATRADYAAVLGQLAGALRLHRSAEAGPGGASGKRKSPPPCVCGCGRRIRVAPAVLAAGPITCGACGSDFEPADEDGQDTPGEVPGPQATARRAQTAAARST